MRFKKAMIDILKEYPMEPYGQSPWFLNVPRLVAMPKFSSIISAYSSGLSAPPSSLGALPCGEHPSSLEYFCVRASQDSPAKLQHENFEAKHGHLADVTSSHFRLRRIRLWRTSTGKARGFRRRRIKIESHEYLVLKYLLDCKGF